MLSTLSGRLVASAMRDEMMLDEFVVRMAWGGHILSSSAKQARLASWFSMMASMTKSALPAAAWREGAKVSRWRAAAVCSAVRRPLATRSSSHLVAHASAFFTASGMASQTLVLYPARAHTMAICDPMAPAPMTAI